MIISTFEVT